MNKSISIIIPTYNSGQFIKRTIFSILEQRNFSFQIIVVDSGSTDGTVEFCQKYVNKVIYCPPGNMYTAINLGIISASYENIAYINSDDYYYEDVLNDYILFFIKGNYDFSYALGDIVDPNGRFRSSFFTPAHKDLLGYFKAGIMPFIQPTVIFKKAAFNELNGFDDSKYKYCADFDFCFRAVSNGLKIGFYKKRVVCFRVTNNQITNIHSNLMTAELNKIVCEFGKKSILSNKIYHIKYKVNNLSNIVMRILRVSQLTGKISFTKVLSPTKE